LGAGDLGCSAHECIFGSYLIFHIGRFGSWNGQQ
jgi:hypothetical protein